MKASEIKTYYRLNLPHIQPLGAAFFVTFRLDGSIPQSKLFELKQIHKKAFLELGNNNFIDLDRSKREQQNHFFLQYDHLLDTIPTGPHYLRNPEIAKLVEKELHRFDGELYDLMAYCIMSNHVHLLIDTSIQIPEDGDDYIFEISSFEPLANIMKRIKGPTAIYANRLLNRKGKFWQRESYDHYIRNEKELLNIISYILENPVKAGLVQDWVMYPFSYLKEYE